MTLEAAGLPAIESAPPAAFDGPGDKWSPESLLCAAVAGCLVLTFRAIARASKLNWLALECRVDGTLERVEGVTRFTGFLIHARLSVPAGASPDLCRRLVEKAERGCLVTNSLQAQRTLEVEIETEESAAAG